MQDAAAGTDTSAVVSGTVLVKKVSHLTRAPATEADSVDAFPGDVLRSGLTATNTGPQAAMLLVVLDTLTPQAASLTGSLTLNGAALSDASDTDDGEVEGRDVSVRVPALTSGAQAKVCFQVQVP